MTLARFILLIALLLLFIPAHSQGFIMPRPVDGLPATEEFFAQEMIYPQQALEKEIKGEVWLKFNVMADGSVQEMRIWKTLEAACDAEALRLARLVQWLPASMGDSPVDAEHSLVVKFDPREYRRSLKKRKEIDPTIAGLPVHRSFIAHPASHVADPPQPLIPKGAAGVPDWCRQHLQYPPEALRRSIQGPVKVRFVVEPSGNLSNMHSITDLGGGCVPEAIRVLRSMQWRPGIADGKRVRTQMEMEIVFKLP